jgi:amidase
VIGRTPVLVWGSQIPKSEAPEVRRAGQQCERIRQAGENVNGCRSETSEPERRRRKAPSQSFPQGGLLCDTALGTDSGGSVRVPASFCGLYGIRPIHGRLDVTGMMPQAPSSDTIGWFARDAATFARVAEALLGEPIPDHLPTRLVVAVDALGFADADTAAALEPMIRKLSAIVRDVREDLLAPPGLSAWSRAQRTLQPHEAWLTFRDWLDRDNPRLQFSVARGLVLASAIPESERQWASLVRAEARARLHWLLPPGTILCMPTTPFPAPRKGLPLGELDPLRARISCLTSHGGLTGVPQVSLPGATVEGLPVGLSILGARGSDAALVAVAKAMEARR